MAAHIIPFNAEERLLTKVRGYISALDRLMGEADQAIDLFVRALKVADEELRLKIVLMLGTLARPQVIWPLYGLMRDGQESESIRQAAAIQLSVVGGMVEGSEALVEQLLADLGHADPMVRANAAFAMGWEGNRRAVEPLAELLHDPDAEVQQAAVNALSNLQDERLFQILTERLAHGSQDQQRTILYNLYRFASRQKEIVDIYILYLQHPQGDLRYDALAVFDVVADTRDHLDVYAKCLQDSEARIRELALVRLGMVDAQALAGLKPQVRSLLKDPLPQVRQAAIKLLRHMEPLPISYLS